MPSQDPRQQEVRDRKKVWNGAYKHFGQGLRQFKDSLNGKGKNPSNIKDPLPSQLASMLDGLSSEFAELVQGAHEIFTDQSNYSKNRRKKKPKQVQQPSAIQSAAPQQDKIVEQLSQIASAQSTDLQVLGTSRLSRSWQYFKSMFYRDEIEKQRVSLLRMCADLFYSLRDFQNEVLTININNTPNLLQSFQSARYSFSSVHSTIARLAEIIEQGKVRADQAQSEQEKKPQQPQPSSAKPQQPAGQSASPPARRTSKEMVDQMRREAIMCSQDKSGLPFSDQIIELSSQYLTATSDQEKHAIRSRMQELRKEMLTKIENDIKAREKKKADADPSLLIKEGHNVLTRFVKRQLTKMRPGNETASLRLDISNSIDEAEKELRVVMDSLHQKIDIELLNEGIVQLKAILENIGKPLKVILSLYERDLMKDPKNRQKFRGRNQRDSGDPSIDLLLKRRIRNDLAKGIL